MAEKAFETVIGIELHTQLNTKTKLFCRCKNTFGDEANINTCPVCLGHPGALPVFNLAVRDKAIKLTLAIGGKVNTESYFERKSYFYPDLPKSYQISQLARPICVGGSLTFFCEPDGEGEGYEKTVRINRIQIEEDAGKLLHDKSTSGTESFVDLNRAGTPLCEIVSEPEIYSAKEAAAYFRAWRDLLLYLSISDVNMQEGNLRCDANISLREKGATALGVRTEIKNMNTFKGVEAALLYEQDRQGKILASGGEVLQQTMLFDPDKRRTVPMRSKEESEDYRFFVDPDLTKVEVTNSLVNSIQQTIPELPFEKRRRYVLEYGLSQYDSWLMSHQKERAAYFETTVDKTLELLGKTDNEDSQDAADQRVVAKKVCAKKVCNWISSEVLSFLNDEKLSLSDFRLSPSGLAQLLAMLQSNKITGKTAKEVFKQMIASGESAQAIVEKSGLSKVTDLGQIEKLVQGVMDASPDAVQDYKQGNQKTLGFLIGQVMKHSKGQADPVLVNKVFQKKLQ